MKIDAKHPAARVGSALLVLVLLTFGLHLVRIPTSAAADFPCGTSSTGTANIQITSGESGSSIASSLFKFGIVKSAEAYFRVAVGDIRSQRVAPGNHNLDVGICAKEALNQLLDSSRITGLINISEGAWISELVPQFVAAGISQQDLSQTINSSIKPAGFTALEGLLFPAQYSFEKGTSAKIALEAMISRAVNEMHKAGFYGPKKEFTPQQLLIIASLVQAEGNTQDFPKISRVIRNRLTKGMPLQFDSTVHYIKKTRGSVFLSTASTLINSPYNTYKHYGLPPGPINNPGADAMHAAANPAPGDWLFFITVAPFDTRYTNSLDQFNTWKVEYEKNLKAGKFRSTK